MFTTKLSEEQLKAVQDRPESEFEWCPKYEQYRPKLSVDKPTSAEITEKYKHHEFGA